MSDNVHSASRRDSLNGEVLNTFAAFFSPLSHNHREEVTRPSVWQHFVAHLPLRERDTDALLSALPSENELASFYARHFTGGLKHSVLPIESLYRTWTKQGGCAMLFAQEKGLYFSDSAGHMHYLFESLDIKLDTHLGLPPDHLSNELGFLALLTEYGRHEDCVHFVHDHLSWLREFLDLLQERAPEAVFMHQITAALIVYLGVSDKEEGFRRYGE